MLNLFKKIIAGGLIAGSVTFAVLIIASNSPSPSASATSLADLEQLRSEIIPNTTMEGTNNLTENASRAIGDSIIASGVTSADQLQSPEAIAAEYLAEASKSFDYNSLKPVVSADRLKIVVASDSRLVSIYIKGINDALSPAFSDLRMGKDAQVNLKIMSTAYDQAINTLYTMSVPQIFGHLHQEVIANLGGQKAATEMITKNFGNDPVRSLLALQAITKLNEDLAIIQKAIIDLADKS